MEIDVNKLFLGIIAGLLVACGTQVAALSGADEARLVALESLTALQQTQIAALQTAVNTLNAGPRPAVFIQAPGAANVQALKSARSTNAATAVGGAAADADTCTGLGTLTGRPDNSNPITSSLIGGVSCTGYLFVVSDAASAAEEGYLQPISNFVRFYATSDCSGPGYISRQGSIGRLSADVFIKGAVFGDVDTRTGVRLPNLYVPAGAPKVTVPYGSASDGGGGCGFFPSPFMVEDAVQLLPNDPAITRVPNGPIPGPITIGTNP